MCSECKGELIPEEMIRMPLLKEGGTNCGKAKPTGNPQACEGPDLFGGVIQVASLLGPYLKSSLGFSQADSMAPVRA